MTSPAILEHAAYEVRRALREEGRQPQWHRSLMARHRAEWPVLWAALDQLVAAIDAVERGDVDRPRVLVLHEPVGDTPGRCHRCGEPWGDHEQHPVGDAEFGPDEDGEFREDGDPIDLDDDTLAMRREVAEGYGESIDLSGAFDVEPVESMRCGRDVGGFRCTRPLGHDGRCWTTGTSTIEGS